MLPPLALVLPPLALSQPHQRGPRRAVQLDCAHGGPEEQGLPQRLGSAAAHVVIENKKSRIRTHPRPRLVERATPSARPRAPRRGRLSARAATSLAPNQRSVRRPFRRNAAQWRVGAPGVQGGPARRLHCPGLGPGRRPARRGHPPPPRRAASPKMRLPPACPTRRATRSDLLWSRARPSASTLRSTQRAQQLRRRPSTSTGRWGRGGGASGEGRSSAAWQAVPHATSLSQRRPS